MVLLSDQSIPGSVIPVCVCLEDEPMEKEARGEEGGDAGPCPQAPNQYYLACFLPHSPKLSRFYLSCVVAVGHCFTIPSPIIIISFFFKIAV